MLGSWAFPPLEYNGDDYYYKNANLKEAWASVLKCFLLSQWFSTGASSRWSADTGKLIIFLCIYTFQLPDHYICIFVSAQASSFKVTQIDLSLRLTKHPQDITVRKGQPATFRCDASSSSGSPQFTWLFNGNHPPLNDSRIEVDKDGTLKFNEAVKRFEGNYQCLVENDFGKLLSNPAKLKIACKCVFNEWGAINFHCIGFST